MRLVRLLRDNNYWVAELIKQLLDKEAQSTHEWTINDIRKMLDNFETIEALADNAQRLGQNWSNHPILRAIRDTWGDQEIQDYVGDGRVQRLIESARRK